MLSTRRLEFDAGHRIPGHHSQCRHLHGHRYAIEVTLSGDIITTEGAAEQGIVMDYSEVKRIAAETLVDAWDHAFLVYVRDAPVVGFLRSLPGHKTVELEVPPTAENLALIAFRILERGLSGSLRKQDLGIVLDTGKKLTLPLPLTSTAHQMFLMASAAGHGGEDDSAVVKVFQTFAGIPLPEKKRRTAKSARARSSTRKPRAKRG